MRPGSSRGDIVRVCGAVPGLAVATGHIGGSECQPRRPRARWDSCVKQRSGASQNARPSGAWIPGGPVPPEGLPSRLWRWRWRADCLRLRPERWAFAGQDHHAGPAGMVRRRLSVMKLAATRGGSIATLRRVSRSNDPAGGTGASSVRGSVRPDAGADAMVASLGVVRMYAAGQIRRHGLAGRSCRNCCDGLGSRVALALAYCPRSKRPTCLKHELVRDIDDKGPFPKSTETGAN
jgi:hypothetical protein